MTAPVICERYVLPTVDGLSGWAIIHIDSAGFFATVSDFGNYAFCWSNTGVPLKRFLIQLANDPHYLCKKLWSGRPLEFDADTTCKRIREHILANRRDRSFTRERARSEWELVEDITNEFSFGEWYRETTVYDPSEWASYAVPLQCRAFCEQVYPRFVELLRAEIASAA